MLQTIVQKKMAPNVKTVSVWIRSVIVTMGLEDVIVKFQVCETVYVVRLLFIAKYIFIEYLFNTY